MKEGIVEKIGKYASRLPAPVKTVGKNLLLTPDSWTYGVMDEATELGDFVSKYVLYNHYLDKGMNKQDALDKVATEFIDYGALTNRSIDYSSSIGLMFFFKYFMRIQPVIASMIVENPARVLTQLLVRAAGYGLDSPLESFAPTKDLGYKTGLYDLLSGYFSHPLINAIK